MTSPIHYAIIAVLFAASSIGAVGTASANERYMFQSVRHLPDSEVDWRVQAATRACDPAEQQAYETPAFKHCMLRLGWRYTLVQRYRAPPRSQEDADLDKRNADESNAAQQRREEEQRNAESLQNMIQMNQPQ